MPTPLSRLGRTLKRSIKITLAAFFCAFLLGSNAITQDARNQTPAAQGAPRDDECEQLRKAVPQLRTEVARLKADVTKLEKYRQVDYLREQLLKEEQRIEALQRELIDIGAKEMPLQARLDEIDAQLRPDRIEQSLAGVGSTRPEEQREAIQRQLSNEKRRIQTQLDQFRQNRPRLQASITSAEAAIPVLKQRLREAIRAAGLTDR
jgi:peptidoglycan hydrolase CwlO-like protein